MQILLIVLKLLPMVLQIIQLIQRHRLTAEATQQMVDDLTMTADYLAASAGKARAEVKDTAEEVQNDPLNRD